MIPHEDKGHLRQPCGWLLGVARRGEFWYTMLAVAQETDLEDNSTKPLPGQVGGSLFGFASRRPTTRSPRDFPVPGSHCHARVGKLELLNLAGGFPAKRTLLITAIPRRQKTSHPNLDHETHPSTGSGQAKGHERREMLSCSKPPWTTTLQMARSWLEKRRKV